MTSVRINKFSDVYFSVMEKDIVRPLVISPLKKLIYLCPILDTRFIIPELITLLIIENECLEKSLQPIYGIFELMLKTSYPI